METIADKDQKTALYAFNAKSLWTFELEDQLLSGKSDLIAHSLKDMPTQLPEGCILGAACMRDEKRDAVVMSLASVEKGWKTLRDLPDGSVVGTSSTRRIAQLKRLYPALKIADMRGNINTRLRKLDSDVDEDGTPKFAALILAATGLKRVGLGDRVSACLSWEDGGWLGAVGQGALGVEVREGDIDVERLCQLLMQSTHEGNKVWLEVLTERMLLRTLEGGCSVPIGVESNWVEDQLDVRAVCMSVDGQREVRTHQRKMINGKEEAEAFGLALAQEMVENGAGEILKEITLNRKIIADGGGA